MGPMKAFPAILALSVLTPPVSAAPSALQHLMTAAGVESLSNVQAPVPPAAIGPASGQPTDDWLLRQTYDPDPAVRARAVRALRGFTGSRVSRRVQDLAQDREEAVAVRAEAAKNLATGSSSRDDDILHRLAEDRDEPKELRSWALKALYAAASRSTRSRDRLVAVLTDRRQPEALRSAAAWALFPTVGDRRTAAELLAVALDGLETDALRIEALKSLHAGLGYDRHRDAVQDLAAGAAPVEVRVAATLILHFDAQNRRSRDFLQNLAENAAEPAVRDAAIEALTARLSEERVAWLHLWYYGGAYRDPLP